MRAWLFQYRVILALCLALITPALACNYPFPQNNSVNPDQRLVETAVAELLETAQAATPAVLPTLAFELTSPPTATPVAPVPPTLAPPGPVVETATPPPTPTLPVQVPIMPGATLVPLSGTGGTYYLYPAQSGDTLASVAAHFEAAPEQITSAEPIPGVEMLRPGQWLAIPNVIEEAPYPSPLLPDSEVVYSPSAAGFDIQGFVASAGGYLSTYRETVGGQSLTGAEVVARIATETSVNPRLLLAFLEYRAGWVFGQPRTNEQYEYPIGFYVPNYRGLYKELSLTAKQLNLGYYGWRYGTLTELAFADGPRVRIHPGLNAGSVAVQYLFSSLFRSGSWVTPLYGTDNFITFYGQMFGDPWARAVAFEPLLPAGLEAPPAELPFSPGERWSFTAGPHVSWTTGSPRGALDFAPVTGEPACAVSVAWVTSSTPGLVIRSTNNVVTVDLDGDGYEQTGWVFLYLHLADSGRVASGTWVNTDDPLGHPSCQGGSATGTHVHISRKYNGEWIAAAGPLPFVLSGWEAVNASNAYEGFLVKGDQVVSARPDGSRSSSIFR